MTVDTMNGLPDGQNPAIPDSGTANAAPPDTSGSMADRDASELAAALAAAQAEDVVADPAAVVPAADPPPAAPPPAPAAPATPPAPQGQVMVPKARLDQEARARRTAEQLADYRAAEIEALRNGAGTPPAPATAPQGASTTPVSEQINARQAEVLDAARKYDAGEITSEELVRTQQAADAAIAELRFAAFQAPQQAAAQPGIADQIVLQTQLQTLEAQHPYTRALDSRQAQLLANIARTEAAAAGQPYGSTAADTMNLRAHVAALSDLYGPRWGLTLPPGAQAPAAPQSRQQAQQPRPTGAQAPAMSAEAQARLAAMDRAAGLPPDTAAIGAAGMTGDDITEARIATMSDEEIGALPAAVRNRILSG
jgi:hypothetical protein